MNRKEICFVTARANWLLLITERQCTSTKDLCVFLTDQRQAVSSLHCVECGHLLLCEWLSPRSLHAPLHSVPHRMAQGHTLHNWCVDVFLGNGHQHPQRLYFTKPEETRRAQL